MTDRPDRRYTHAELVEIAKRVFPALDHTLWQRGPVGDDAIRVMFTTGADDKIEGVELKARADGGWTIRLFGRPVGMGDSPEEAAEEAAAFLDMIYHLAPWMMERIWGIDVEDDDE